MSDSVAITFTQYEFLAVMRDGFDYQLDYSYVPSDLVGQPEEVSETRDGTVVVGASRTLATSWRLGREDLEKVLFEYAKRHIRAKAEEGSLGGRSEIQLTTANAARRCPFDPTRVQLEIGTPIHFEMPKRNPVAAAEPASLPSQIIDLRDSINAIFGETFRGRLLALPQERHIVELFKECKDHESFAYRVASIGGLATAIIPDDIDRRVPSRPASRKPKEKEKPTDSSRQAANTLDLLGRFLRTRYPENQVTPIMEALKNFNHLRRMYPVHTDRAGGVLSAHRFFDLDYPVQDHVAAGRRLLEAYRDILAKLLALLKTANR